jgi:hypothetical protein
LIILRKRYTRNTWYIAGVLRQLAAPRLKFQDLSETSTHFNPGAANLHNTHEIYQVLLVNAS